MPEGDPVRPMLPREFSRKRTNGILSLAHTAEHSAKPLHTCALCTHEASPGPESASVASAAAANSILRACVA